MSSGVIAGSVIALIILVLWAVVGGGARDKSVAQARKNAAAFQARAAGDPDWALTETARTLGLALDLTGDRVTAQGQATGRFTGSRITVETLGDINRNPNARNLRNFGVAGALMKPDGDDREMYLTVHGDGYQVALRVDAARGDEARAFAAAYNTRSGALSASAGPVGGVAGQLAELGRLHSAGQLSDEEFAAAKNQLLGQPQDRPW